MELTLGQQAQLRGVRDQMLNLLTVLQGLSDFAEFREEKASKNLNQIKNALSLTTRLIEVKNFLNDEKAIVVIIQIFSTVKYSVEFNDFHQGNITFQRIPKMRDLIKPVEKLIQNWNLFFNSIEENLERIERFSKKRFTFFKNKKLRGILPV